MKRIFLLLCLLGVNFLQAQEIPNSQIFWNNLREHCGNAYEGTLAPNITNDDFTGKKLIMFIRTCSENTISIPFYVGEDKSRTWIFSLENDRMKLKHDHRHRDGSEDRITQYGGISTNEGLAELQFFPADDETAELISYASTNVWWITLTNTTFTYNLKRIGTDNAPFTVIFDLTRPVENPGPQWGRD